ncbi:uncharacterized protein LOC144559019 [Carex rostrata]
MSSCQLVTTGIPIPKSDLSLGLNASWKFNCKICKATGEQLVCFCNKCNSSMHPTCAGVEAWTVYGANGTKQVVLPSSENLPKSCPECLRKEGIMMTNQVFLQQTNYMQAPSSSSITSFIELGKPHKVERGHGDCMVHIHNPGHDLLLKDNGNYICDGCKMDGFGPHYACRNASCPFLLHQECLSPRKTTTHRFFPQSTFLFMCLPSTSYSKHGKKEQTNVFCDACGMNVKGYYYHDQNGKYHLHPCCVNLPSQIIDGDSGAKMVLQKESTSKCGYCLQRSVKMGRISTNHVWSYVANNENIHFHVGCMIKMIYDRREDSMARLISCNMTSANGSARMNLVIALRQVMNTGEREFQILVKYFKIISGAVISSFLGNPITLFVNTALALSSN